jgi:regulator of sigma E protease
MLTTIFITLATIGVLVTIHEWGHFYVARCLGVKVLRFSVGFGTALYKWSDKKGTEYVIAAIPLGGYVKMLDEREGEVPADQVHQTFNRKPALAKLAIVLAGPFINLIFAFVLYWSMFVAGVTEVVPIVGNVLPHSPAAQAGLQVGSEIVSIDGEATSSWEKVNLKLVRRVGDSGFIDLGVKSSEASAQTIHIAIGDWLQGKSITDTLKALGIERWEPFVPAIIDNIEAGGRAEQAGLKIGDEIITVDNHTVKDWPAWVDAVRSHPEKLMVVTVKRNNQLLTFQLTPATKRDEKGSAMGYVGVGVKPPELPKNVLRESNYNLLTALSPAFNKTREMSVVTLKSLIKLVEGKLSIKNLSGPITIAKVASDSAKAGVLAFVGFLAYLSLTLGVFNLLPIPVLDGGHVVYYTIEGIIGKPLPEKVQMIGAYIGIGLIAGVSLIAIYNDILSLR